MNQNHGKPRKKKILQVTACVLLALFIILFGAGIYAGNFFYNVALNPATNKDDVLSAPHNKVDYSKDEDITPEEKKWQEERQEWVENVQFEDVYLQSYDDLKLHGNVLMNENQTNRWAILFHGYGGHGLQMKRSAKDFYDMGFNILMPDARGLGDSEGHYIGMGWHERLDGTDWINQIVEQNNDAEIILYGVSMGGATVMMISGEQLPTNVKAIVEDCGYSSVWDEFSYQLKSIYGLPSFPVMNFASLVTKFRAGFFLEEGSAVKQVAKSTTPMLFIHGDNDTFVPSAMLDVVYDAANVTKEKLLVEGAGHGAAASIDRVVYWDTVTEFINRFLTEKAIVSN